VVPRQQLLEEAPSCVGVSTLLNKHIDDIAVLVDGSPRVALLPLNPNEDLVNEKGLAVGSMCAPHATGVLWSKIVAPEANGFVGYDDSAPGQQIIDVPMAQIEPVVEPDGVLDDLGRKSVPLVVGRLAFHQATVAKCGLIWQYPIFPDVSAHSTGVGFFVGDDPVSSSAFRG